MWKLTPTKQAATAVVALALTGGVVAQAQTAQSDQTDSMRLTASDWKAITDARIGLVKAALQVKPDQEKLWAPVETAIRARAQGRQQRLTAIKALANDQQKHDPIALMQTRAASLTQRGEGLKQLADAWQPLYQSLDQDQKRRLTFLTVHVLGEMRNAAGGRRANDDEEDED